MLQIRLVLGILFFTSLFKIQASVMQEKELGSFDWLVGTWEMNDEEGVAHQVCKKINNEEYELLSYAVEENGGLVLISEARLFMKNGIWLAHGKDVDNEEVSVTTYSENEVTVFVIEEIKKSSCAFVNRTETEAFFVIFTMIDKNQIRMSQKLDEEFISENIIMNRIK